MNKITGEIKEQYEYYKENCPPVPICRALPFNTYDQMWMYYHLFPEVLQVYDEYVQEKYERYPTLLTLREYLSTCRKNMKGIQHFLHSENTEGIILFFPVERL